LVRIRCGRCKRTIIDTKNNVCKVLKLFEATFKVPEVGMDIDIEYEDYIACEYCGNKSPLSRFKDKPFYKELVEFIERRCK